MAFSQATLIKRIRNILNDDPFLDTCTEAMDTTETGLDVADGTQYAAGTTIEFQDDGERCYVQAVVGNALTVVRNYNFSVTTTAGTGTSHNSGAQIARRPTFQYAQIVDAISGAIKGLYPHAYKEIDDSVTPVTGTHWYNVGTNAITIRELSSVTQATTDTPAKPFYYGTNRGAYPIELRFNIPTSIAANGAAYFIPYLKNVTNAINVNGIAQVTDTVATGSYSDLTDGVQVDCVAYYAVARLIASTDISRSTQEDISMSDESVKPGSRTQLAAYWEQKALAERHKWEQELKITLPRMHVWGHF